MHHWDFLNSKNLEGVCILSLKFDLKSKNSKLPAFKVQKQIITSSPEICLSKNTNLTAWDGWGVRDVAILTDGTGAFENDSGKMIMYYSGSKNEGSCQQTGRAISIDSGKSWNKEPDYPVICTSEDGWDCSVASTSWVIKYNRKFYLYYRGSQKACANDAIGLATSNDGINFKKHNANPILTAKDFPGIRQNPSCMGVLNAVQDYDGKLIVLFEAHEKNYQQKGQIFAAKSCDGIKFTAINEGEPIFSNRNVKTWPVVGVCNPRLSQIGDGWFMLGFNGTYAGEYAVGIAYTQNFVDWYDHPSNPIIVPRGWPSTDPFSGRIEGLCIDTANIKKKSTQLLCFFMSIPFAAKNHQNAVIAKTKLKFLKQNKGSKYKIKASPSSNESFKELKNSVIIDSNIEKSKYLQSHLISENFIEKISVKMNTYFKNIETSAVYMIFSNTLNSLPRGIGTTLRFTSESIDIREHSPFARGQSHAPLKFWRKIAIVTPETNKFQIDINVSKKNLYYSVNCGEKDKNNQSITIDQPFRIMTFACYEAKSKFKILKLN